MNRYVLDTSALLTLIENEEGSEEIEVLLRQALNEEIELFIAVISSIEVFYISWREQGEEVAHERLKLIENLPVMQEGLTDKLIKIIGEIKATTKMSFADSCICGLAKHREAILVHKGPEFEQVKAEIKQHKLPYKQKSRCK
jgi:predicted nucleic acid-binding protein